MSGSAPTALPALDNTLGAVVIGAVLGTFLFGIGTLQTFHYFRLYADDSWRLKTVVSVVFLAELGHTISLWHALYTMIVTFYGQIEHVIDPPHSLTMTVLFAAIVNLVVQSYFALRIHTLSQGWSITILCSVLTLGRFTFNMIMMVEFWDSSGFAIFQTTLRWLMMCVSIIGPTVDVIIACSLCFYLWRIRSNGSSFAQTKRMIDTLILWSIETTSLTCAAGVLQLILYLSMPQNLIWITFFLMQPKLFSNSILAHLNGRDRFRTGGTKVHNLSDNFDSRGTRPERSVVIQMHTMTDANRDPELYPVDKVSSGSRSTPNIHRHSPAV